jgi:hypothetical protein
MLVRAYLFHKLQFYRGHRLGQSQQGKPFVVHVLKCKDAHLHTHTRTRTYIYLHSFHFLLLIHSLTHSSHSLTHSLG